jgi:hypothetical protein
MSPYRQPCDRNDLGNATTFIYRCATLRVSTPLNADTQSSNLAQWLGKPVLHLSQQRDRDSAAELLKAFIKANHIKVLNVAGSRGSKEARVGEFVREVLLAGL